MNINQFHFSEPIWLSLLAMIPIFGILFYLFYQPSKPSYRLEKLIDKHLLPYLLIGQKESKNSLWKSFFAWTILWSCLAFALAGPRWSFREIETYSKEMSLVILLDLSESMNAQDLKPSRLVRAKQKIEDILNENIGAKIALVAFAADPHMITPLTEDKETIRHLLPSLQTNLPYVQGSRLSSAIEMATMLLKSEPGQNKAILIISDGGFEDSSAITTAKNLADKGIIIHTLGVGTTEGAPLQDHEGHLIKKEGKTVLSKLENEKLKELSRIGQGRYLEIQQESAIVLQDLDKKAEHQIKMGKKNRLWDEQFYYLIFPAIPIMLWWFRKGSFYIFILFSLLSFKLEAVDISYFKNSEQIGEKAFNQQDYQTAIHSFKDNYRKGVAYYKAGQFEAAEEMFRLSSREEVSSQAAYNLGNALVFQQKLKEAIQAYENVLEKWPDHIKAKENLEIVKKMLEEQNQNEPPPQENDNDKEKEQQEQSDNQSEQNQNESNEKEQQEQPDNQSEQNQNESNEKEQTQNKQQPSKSEEQHSTQHHDQSQADQDADQWLNQIESDPSKFLQNKFYIESKKNGTKEGVDPW